MPCEQVYRLRHTHHCENLRQVEQAEDIVRSFCPPNVQVRVRHHGTLARIEAAPQVLSLLAAPERAAGIAASLAALGFAWVTLDLAGYRMGSMNELLADRRDRSGGDPLAVEVDFQCTSVLKKHRRLTFFLLPSF